MVWRLEEWVLLFCKKSVWKSLEWSYVQIWFRRHTFMDFELRSFGVYALVAWGAKTGNTTHAQWLFWLRSRSALVNWGIVRSHETLWAQKPCFLENKPKESFGPWRVFRLTDTINLGPPRPLVLQIELSGNWTEARSWALEGILLRSIELKSSAPWRAEEAFNKKSFSWSLKTIQILTRFTKCFRACLLVFIKGHFTWR